MTKRTISRNVAVGLAVFAYLVAVTQRTTMGSVALDAAHRFQTNAEQLSSLAVLQLLFYAGMQIPVGILLDRFGSRALLASGALLMASGQITVAFSHSLALAVFGRILVGIGDACTFISMIRMTNSWFSGRQASHLQQWFATTGQLGQILSAIPFAFLLHMTSWEAAFTSVTSLAVLSGALVWLFARENSANEHHGKVDLGAVLTSLKLNAKRPITWLAFFTHFTTQSTGTMFALLWGIPFMVSALGMSHAVAGGYLTLFVCTNATMGPVIGWFCARWPHRRQAFVYSVVGAIVLAWFVLLLTGPAVNPIAFALFVMVIAVGGPSSMIAFDYSKESIPARELGASNGLINSGGFLAALTMMAIVGVVLDLQGGSKIYTNSHFHFAFAWMLLVTAVGLVGLFVSGRKLRPTE
jgi:MFS family permease